MNRGSKNLQPNAFTMIELMVVVAIIGLLVVVLVPAFSTVRRKAAVAKTRAQFAALDTGIQTYRGEDALGGSLPPSASDNRSDRQLIANPQKIRGLNGNKDEVRISGAHLLVHAMLGVDLLGTPGFKDVNAPNGWWDDTNDDPQEKGAYAIDENTGREIHPRYGGYVDEKMQESVKSMAELAEEGGILNLEVANAQADFAVNDPVFVDPWIRPILYYRPGKGTVRMVADETQNKPGIYRQSDNAIITGADAGTFAAEGLDFGDGKIDGRYHNISVTAVPEPTDRVKDLLEDTSDKYKGAFSMFVLDRAVTTRPTPVNKDKYLLISAGPDGRYGTEDDVTNWKRDDN